MVATAIGALFLTQLEQLVLGLGGSESTKLIIQGSIIALGMALRVIPWRKVWTTAVEMNSLVGSRLGSRSPAAGQPQVPEGGDQ